MGVNRISLGIQSFDHHSLRWLGRTHTREQIQETLKRLRQCGFENVNFDLMFGLPGQTLPQWRQTLTEALSLNPQHISAYNLNFEEGTEFLKKLQNGAWKMNEALEKEMFMYAHEFLEKHCFEHYEISNFAPKKWQSVHNLAYWEGENYLGIGPSACSTIDDVRLQNISDTLSYITSVQKSGAPQCSKEPLSSQTKLLEKIFLGLRTKNGIAMKEILPWQNQAADLIQNNLAKIENDRLKLTLNGFLVADEISEIFA